METAGEVCPNSRNKEEKIYVPLITADFAGNPFSPRTLEAAASFLIL